MPLPAAMAADYARRTATRGTDDDQVAAMIRRLADRLLAGRTLPVLTVLATLVVLWYGFAVYLNAPWQRDVYARAKTEWTAADLVRHPEPRSEEHTSELQSLMRISYAVFCLKKKKKKQQTTNTKNTYVDNNKHVIRMQ